MHAVHSQNAHEDSTVKELTSKDALNDCLSQSQSRPVFIFKHSTACPISAGAYDKVVKYIDQKDGEDLPEFYLVKVIESRPVSNEVEALLSVRHQSPQLILVKGGEAAWSASHYGIHAEAISNALARVAAGQ